jgi:hypothetical protein
VLARNPLGYGETDGSASWQGYLAAGTLVTAYTWQSSGGIFNRNDMRVIISRVA